MSGVYNSQAWKFLSRGRTVTSLFVDRLKLAKNDLDDQSTAHNALKDAVTLKSAAAVSARSALDPATTPPVLTTHTGAGLTPDEERMVQVFRNFLKDATSPRDVQSAFANFIAYFDPAKIPTDVSAAIVSLSTNPRLSDAHKQAIIDKLAAAQSEHTAAAAAVPTNAQAIANAALKLSLLEVCEKVIAIHDEQDAKRSLAVFERNEITPRENAIRAVAVNAFLESALRKHRLENVKKAAKTYHGLQDLCDMWGIEPNIALLNSLDKDYGIQNVFGDGTARGKLEVRNQTLVFSSPNNGTDPVKYFRVNSDGIQFDKNMTHQELTAVLKYAFATWGEEGLHIKEQDKAVGARIAFACDELARTTGDDSYTNYKITFAYAGPFNIDRQWLSKISLPNTTPFLKRTWHGAKHQVGERKAFIWGQRHLSTSRRYAHLYEAAMLEANRPAAGTAAGGTPAARATISG